MQKAVFLDKDGTLVRDVPYNVDPDKMVLEPFAPEALKRLRAEGYRLIVVSNQAGVALGYFKEEALQPVKHRLEQLLELTLDDFYYCPHTANECNCRKPMPGMLLKAASQHDIDLANSWMIGDILNDVEAGGKAGCRTILIDNGNETEWVLDESRKPTHIVHNLKEAAALIIGYE